MSAGKTWNGRTSGDEHGAADLASPKKLLVDCRLVASYRRMTFAAGG
jgi:hypothetical protein